MLKGQTLCVGEFFRPGLIWLLVFDFLFVWSLEVGDDCTWLQSDPFFELWLGFISGYGPTQKNKKRPNDKILII